MLVTHQKTRKQLGIRINRMQVRVEVGEKVVLELSFERIKSGYNADVSGESIPTTRSRIGKSFFPKV